MLLFKTKFLDAIRSGRKTQTIRMWKFRRMRTGQRSYIPGVGVIQVHSVEQVDLADLTEDDACRDGFDSVDALRKEIDSIYGQDSDEQPRQPYRVRFSILVEETPEE